MMSSPPEGPSTGPESIGVQKAQPDPRGWLVFDHLPDALQRAEDATAARDREMLEEWGASLFGRAATDAERILLEHLGFTVPDDLVTRVSVRDYGMRNRRWPALESPASPEFRLAKPPPKERKHYA